ncbi:MAG: M48 family metalloprotease [Gemmatimonadetes bacterium]|jgi:heat shock protein HtpX|nr:M48 family metalloprotease [Gemmatimonadota bacterium]
MYRLQSLVLMAGLVALFAITGYWLFGWLGGAMILALAIAVNWLGVDGARDAVLRLHGARPLARHEAPGIYRLVEDLAERAGIPMPVLAIYPSQAPNAFAIAARRRDPVIAVSTELLRLLPPREVRGVLAHEVTHLRNKDSALSLMAGVFTQVIGVLSQTIGLLLFLGLLLGALPGQQLWPALLVALVAPALATLLQAGLQRTRERLADLEAARLTGDPRGLAAALHRLQQYSRYLRGWLGRFRFLYTADTDRGTSWLRTHPPTAQRVRELLALEAAWQAGSRLPAGYARVA